MLDQLIKLVTYLEPIARANGYHVGITGSCVYGGHCDLEDQDMDVIVYWDSGEKPSIRPFELLKDKFKVPGHIRDCCDYQERDRTREVLSTEIQGIKVDFIFLRA